MLEFPRFYQLLDYFQASCVQHSIRLYRDIFRLKHELHPRIVVATSCSQHQNVMIVGLDDLASTIYVFHYGAMVVGFHKLRLSMRGIVEEIG